MTVPIDPIIRIFGATSFLILVLISLALNLLLMAVLIQQGIKEFKKNSFYMLVWQYVICDLINLTIQFIIVTPIVYAGFNIYGGPARWFYIITCLDSIAYTGFVMFSFLLTISRFTVFILPKLNKFMFEPPGLYLSIIFGWGISFAIHIFRTFIGINKTYLDTEFLWDNIKDQPLKGTIKTIDDVQKNFHYYAPLCMLGVYFFIVAYIKIIRPKHKSNNKNHKRNNYSIIFQSFLICGSLALELLAFRYVPQLQLVGQWHYLLNFFQNWIMIFLYTSNPIILFVFNKEIRRSLVKLLVKMKIVKPKLVTQDNNKLLTVSSNIMMMRRSQISIVR